MQSASARVFAPIDAPFHIESIDNNALAARLTDSAHGYISLSIPQICAIYSDWIIHTLGGSHFFCLMFDARTGKHYYLSSPFLGHAPDSLSSIQQYICADDVPRFMQAARQHEQLLTYRTCFVSPCGRVSAPAKCLAWNAGGHILVFAAFSIFV